MLRRTFIGSTLLTILIPKIVTATEAKVPAYYYLEEYISGGEIRIKFKDLEPTDFYQRWQNILYNRPFNQQNYNPNARKILNDYGYLYNNNAARQLFHQTETTYTGAIFHYKFLKHQLQIDKATTDLGEHKGWYISDRIRFITPEPTDFYGQYKRIYDKFTLFNDTIVSKEYARKCGYPFSNYDVVSIFMTTLHHQQMLNNIGDQADKYSYKIHKIIEESV